MFTKGIDSHNGLFLIGTNVRDVMRDYGWDRFYVMEDGLYWVVHQFGICS